MRRPYRAPARRAAVLPTCSGCGGDIYTITHKYVHCAFTAGPESPVCGMKLHEECLGKIGSSKSDPRCKTHARM